MTRSAGCSQNYNTISHQHSLLTPTPLVSRDTTGRIIGDRMDAGGEPADDLPVCAGNFQGANKGKTCVIWTDYLGKTSCLYCLTEYTIEDSL